MKFSSGSVWFLVFHAVRYIQASAWCAGTGALLPGEKTLADQEPSVLHLATVAENIVCSRQKKADQRLLV